MYAIAWCYHNKWDKHNLSNRLIIDVCQLVHHMLLVGLKIKKNRTIRDECKKSDGCENGYMLLYAELLKKTKVLYNTV